MTVSLNGNGDSRRRCWIPGLLLIWFTLVQATELVRLDSHPSPPRGWAWDVDVVGDHAYVANGVGGLLIVDVSDPSVPSPVGGINTRGIARSVLVSGAHAFIADDKVGLQVVGLNDATKPTLLATLESVGPAVDLARQGHLLAVASGTNGVEFVDVANPSLPVRLGGLNTVGISKGVALAGNQAFVADGTNGLVVVDLADPTSPMILGRVGTAGDANAVVLSGQYALIANGYAGLAVVDISNLATPILVTNLVSAAAAFDLKLSGANVIVTKSNYLGIDVIDVSTPVAPIRLGGFLPGRQVLGLDVSGGKAYVANLWNGIQIVDLANPAQPSLEGQLNYPAFGARGLARWGSQAVIADVIGFKLVDLSNPYSLKTTWAWNHNQAAITDVEVMDHYAVGIGAHRDMVIVDLADSTTSQPVGSYRASPTTRSDFTGIAVKGSAVIGGRADGFIELVDLSTPANPRHLGLTGAFTPYTPPPNGGVPNPRTVWINPISYGDAAFVGGNNSRTFRSVIVDVRSPVAPRVVKDLGVDQLLIDLKFSGNTGFALTYKRLANDLVKEILAYDMSDPLSPSQVASIEIDTVPLSPPFGPDYLPNLPKVSLVLAGAQLIVPSYETSELVVVDVSNPGSMAIQERIPAAGSVSEMMGAGGFLFAVGDEVLLESYSVESVSTAASPAIFDQPEDATLGEGQPLVLTVGVTGTNNLTCQWFQNQHPIPDATNLWFAVDPALPSHTGLYHVSVTDGPNTVGSEAVQVTVFPVTNPEILGSVISNDFGPTVQVNVSGSFAYVADGPQALRIYDLVPPTGFQHVTTFQPNHAVWELVVTGSYGYINADTAGLKIYDLSVPQSPAFVGEYGVPGGVLKEVVVQGTNSYLAFSNAGLHILDLSDISNPVKIGDHPGGYWDVDLVGSHALLTSYFDSELSIVDVANPSTPSLTSQLRAGKYTFKTVVKGSVAHVLGEWLTTVDVADPENPRILGHLSFEAPPSDIALFDHFGVVSFGAAGLLLLELSEPARPRILRNMTYAQTCLGLTAYGSSLFVSHGGAGFSLLDIGLPALYPPPTLTINQAGSSPMISLDALENQIVVLESVSTLEGSPAWQKVGQFNYLTAPKSWTPPDTGRTREFFRVKTIR